MIGLANVSPFVRVGPDRLSAKYIGRGMHEADVGILQCTSAYEYFEATLLCDEGATAVDGQRCGVSVGFATRGLAHLHSSCDSSHAYQYRAHDGKVFGGPASGDTRTGSHATTSSRGREFGPSFGPGDTVGCGLDLQSRSIFFTKNGVVVGTAFRGVPLPDELVPTVGLHAPGESVSLNFAGGPFVFDVVAHQAADDGRLEAQLDEMPVPRRALRQMVAQYLVREGYAESARALETDTQSMPMNPPSRLRDAADGGNSSAAATSGAPLSSRPGLDDDRRTVRLQMGVPAHMNATHEERAMLRGLLTSGQPEAAVERLEQRGDPSLRFALIHAKSLVFLDFVRRRQVLEAIVYAKEQLLVPFSEEESDSDAGVQCVGPQELHEDGPPKRRRRTCWSGAHVTAAMREPPVLHKRCATAETPSVPTCPTQLPCAVSTVLGILAFDEPTRSPLAVLLTPEYAQSVARLVNEALLQSEDGTEQPHPSPAALEILVRQVKATRKLATELNVA